MSRYTWKLRTRCARCRLLNLIQDEGVDHCSTSCPCAPCESANAPCFSWSLLMKDSEPTLREGLAKTDAKVVGALGSMKFTFVNTSRKNVADVLAAVPVSVMEWAKVEEKSNAPPPPLVFTTRKIQGGLLSQHMDKLERPLYGPAERMKSKSGVVMVKASRRMYEKGREFPDVTFVSDMSKAAVKRRNMIRKRLLDRIEGRAD
ncbi:hypothetical protein HDU67_009907 [Dinochytrium kinnereticum]|nr:hypothetical protein HDU67_009907 [Dinochytrium kinnereticum]